MYVQSNRDFGLRTFKLLLGKSFRIQECLKHSLVKRVLLQMKNSLHQTAFLNTPEFERMYTYVHACLICTVNTR